jgi:hypothetical protein
MSDLQKQIDTAYSNIKSLEPLYADIFERIDTAKAAGDTRQEDALTYEYDLLQKEENRLQNVYGELSKEKEKPNLERVQALTKELRKPIVSPMPNYMNMGGRGGMGIPTPMYPDPGLSIKEQEARKREIVANLYKIPVSPGGMESEKIPTSLMAQVETLQDPTSKAQLLENTYGKGSVLPIDISGKTEFFIKQPDGSVKTTMDKGIAGLAGVAAETPAVLGEIASFLAITGATKSPAVGTAGSAVVGAGIGALTDEMLRYAYNLQPDIGGTAARRGGQAVLSAGIGMGSDVAIPAMRAARMPNPFENVFAQRLESAAERLMTAEQKLAAKEGRKAGQIQVPLAAKLAGQEGAAIQSELAGKYAGSNIASLGRSTQETLLRLSNDLRKGIPVVLSDFSDVAAKKLEQRNVLAQEISFSSGRNKRIVENSLNRLTRSPISDTDNLGKILLTSVKDARTQAIENVRAAREEVLNLADNAGFKITPEEMLDEVARISNQADPSFAANRSAAEEVTNRLRQRRDAPQMLQQAKREAQKFINGRQNPPQDLLQRIQDLELLSKPLTAKDFDEFIKGFNEARPKDVSSGKSRDVFAGKIASGLSQYRRNIFDSLTATRPDGSQVKVGDVFDQYSDEVGTRQKYNENLLGNILQEAGGEQSKDSRAIVSAVMREPDSIKRVVQSIKELGASNPARAGEADKILGLMQVQYMNDIGLGAGKGSQVKIDDGFLDALFGSQAGAQKRALLELNQNLKTVKGLDKADLTLEDIKRMGQPLSEQERKSLIKTIVKRNEFQKQQSELLVSDVFDAAKKGKFENLDADSLSAAILSDKSTLQTANAMKELSKSSLEARNLYKGDFMRYLLDRFPGGVPSANTPFQAPFDTKKFIDAYGPPSGAGVTPFAQKLKIVLGKEQAQELYDMALLWDANIIKKSSDTSVIPRAGLGAGTSFLYIPVGQMIQSTKNRILTAMLSSGYKSNALKAALNSNARPGAVNDVYNQMAREMFMTRQGVTALANQAKDDPEFSLYLTNMAKEFEEKQGLDFSANLIEAKTEPEKQ